MNKTTDEIRRDFLTFFKEKGHIIIPSSSLVPSYDDPTLLFTNAGMNQFKNLFLGCEKIKYSRISTVQRCLRTGGKHNDLEHVGYTKRHHTFFEMLGNFSFNDYFKKDAILYAWELLTSKQWFNIPKNKLWVSVYKDDYETYEIWRSIINIPSEHIVKIGDKNNCKYNSDNFWQMGDSGPCGPCTEIFYDYSDNVKSSLSDFIENKNERFIEIWNIVFIEYNRTSSTNIKALKNKSIDTGMGLERISSVLQNVNSNYNIDIFQKLILSISKFSKIQDLNHISLKIIADHIRSCTYLIADDVTPSNEHRGYILRRIIRRALRHGYQIGIKGQFFYKLVSNVIEVMGTSSNILKEKKEKIELILKKEEIKFSNTLEKGMQILKKEIKKTNSNIFSGKTAFYLYDTFGFPIDLTADVCREKKLKINYSEYELYKDKQKEQSSINNKFYQNYNNHIFINDPCIFKGYKTHKIQSIIKYIFINNEFVSEMKKGENGIIFLDQTSFYPESGGQIGDSGELYNKFSNFIVNNSKKYGKSTGHIGTLVSGKININDIIYSEINKSRRNKIELNHSATHLLHSSLKKVLGTNVSQKGSLVTDKYLRFDFSYSESIKLSDIQSIEQMINTQIQNNILIKTKELNIEDAKKYNAIALFENQYKSIVRIVLIDKFSLEFCGGTHTKRTGNIGLFRIISQSSVASGIKRIEAITGTTAIKYLHKKDIDMLKICHILNSNNFNIKEKIQKLLIEKQKLKIKIDQLQKKENIQYVKKLITQINCIEGINFLVNEFYEHENKSLKNIVKQLKKELKIAVIMLINIVNTCFTMIVGVTDDLTNDITALDIINMLIQEFNGKGGGKKDISEVGNLNIDMLPKILKKIKLWITIQLKNKKNKECI